MKKIMVNEAPDVDISTKTPVKEILRITGKCHKCGHCCEYGSGFLAAGDFENIAKFLELSEEQLKTEFLESGEKFNTTLFRPKLIRKDKPYGECVFYDKAEGCTIQEVKPLHCKIGHCNEHGEALNLWFILNHFVNKNDPESIRQWNVYLKTGNPTITGGRIEDLVPDKETLKKILNYDIFR